MSSAFPGWIADFWAAWLALFSGALLGVVYLVLTRRDRRDDPDIAAEAADAERRKELLVEQLRELSEERHKLGEVLYAAERARLEGLAAEALKSRDRALEGLKRAEAKAARKSRASQGPLARRPQLRGALWGGGIVAIFAILFVVLKSSEAPRVEGGGMGSNNPGRAGAATSDPHDSQLQALIDAVQRSPQDVRPLVALGHELLFRQAFEQASDLTERALRIDPVDVEARAHRAALRSARGDDQGALADLLHLVQRYPNEGEPWLWRGLVARRAGQKDLALDSLRRFKTVAPPGTNLAEMDELIRMIQSDGAPGSPTPP